MLKRVQHDVEGIELAHKVILNLFQDLSAVKENRGSRWDAETSSAWREGIELAHKVILNLFQDLSAVKESRGSRWDAEINSAWRDEREKTERSYTSSAWHNKTTTLNEKRPTISPQTKMSKFAKTKFLLCRVVGVFPSRGSTFFLARQCFGAFTDALIGGWVCKNFYTFSPVLLPVLLPNHLHLFCILPCIKVVGKMRKIAGLKP